jgi:hypothetical protein
MVPFPKAAPGAAVNPGVVISSSRNLQVFTASSFGLAKQSGIGVRDNVFAHWSHAAIYPEGAGGS